MFAVALVRTLAPSATTALLAKPFNACPIIMEKLLDKMLKKYFFRFDFTPLVTISKVCAVLSLALFLMIQAAYAQASLISAINFTSPQVYNPFITIPNLAPANTWRG